MACSSDTTAARSCKALILDIILVVPGCGYFRPFFLPRLGKSSVVLFNSVMLVTFANGRERDRLA